MYFYYNTVQKTMAETFLKLESFCFMHETFNLREKKNTRNNSVNRVIFKLYKDTWYINSFLRQDKEYDTQCR